MSDSDWGQGCVQVYTGNGKGKSTAAFGLALRAAGAGMRVFIAQFLKGRQYSELDAFRNFGDQIDVRQFGVGRFVRGKPDENDMEAAKRGFAEASEAAASGQYRVVILDEGNIAAGLGLFSVKELMALINGRASGVEIVVTGRNAPRELMDRADLVTEMREVKHYFKQGIPARVGIEK